MADWMQTTRAFIISLPRLKARRAHALRLAEAMPVATVILDAVDGTALSASQRSQYVADLHRPRYPFAATQAEIACFLSHRLAWQALVDSGAEQGVILEDDAVLRASFTASLIRLVEGETGWSFVQLHSHGLPESGAPFLGRRRLPQVEMVGQVVKADAARALLRASERFDRPVDSFIQMTWRTGVPIHHLGEPVVANGGIGLGGSTISRKLGFGEKVRRTLVRPVYRTQLALQAAREEAVSPPPTPAPGKPLEA